MATKRILVVDDNMDAAEMLSTMLTLDGHVVETESDGSRVVQRARDFRPEVILMDLGLPGLSGIEVAEALKSAEDLRDIALIALTGYGLERDRSATRAAGFDHHLVKPVEFEAMRAIIGEHRS